MTFEGFANGASLNVCEFLKTIDGIVKVLMEQLGISMEHL